jgi:hypothetical protein
MLKPVELKADSKSLSLGSKFVYKTLAVKSAPYMETKSEAEIEKYLIGNTKP